MRQTLKASEPIDRLERQSEAVATDLGEALRTVEQLERRLLESDEALVQARSEIEFLCDRVDTMDPDKERE